MLIDRDRVNHLLGGIQWRLSYRLFPAVSNRNIVHPRLVCREDVISVLNDARTRTQPKISVLPIHVTAERMSEVCGLDVPFLKRLARRSRNPLPAFRLTNQTFRFDASAVGRWLNGSRLVDLRRRAEKK